MKEQTETVTHVTVTGCGLSFRSRGRTRGDYQSHWYKGLNLDLLVNL